MPDATSLPIDNMSLEELGTEILKTLPQDKSFRVYEHLLSIVGDGDSEKFHKLSESFHFLSNKGYVMPALYQACGVCLITGAGKKFLESKCNQ